MILVTDNGVQYSGDDFILATYEDSDIIITLEVQGTCFPAKRTSNTTATADFRSANSLSNKIYIDYADGTGEHEYNFKSSAANRRIIFTNRGMQFTPSTVPGTSIYDQNPLHFYQDLPVGVINTVDDNYPQHRVIKIRFEFPQRINYISLAGFYGYGVFPSSVSRLRNLLTFSISTLTHLTAFAQDFYNSSITTFVLSNAGSLLNNGILEWMLNSPLVTLNLNSSANLADDPVTKKLSRINELKETLTVLAIPDTGINYTLPNEITELYKLITLSIGDHSSTSFLFPSDVSGFSALTLLNLNNTRMPFTEYERLMKDLPVIQEFNLENCQINTDKDITLPNTKIKIIRIGWNNLWNNRTIPTFVTKLSVLEDFRADYQPANNSMGDNLRHWGSVALSSTVKRVRISQQTGFDTTPPSYFSSLVNLKNVDAWGCFLTQSRTDAFVNNWAAAVVASASMTPGNTKHRNMFFDIWGVSTVIQSSLFKPTGIKQAPAGFVLGSSNGTPASPMEWIYVMETQYGHTWNTKP